MSSVPLVSISGQPHLVYTRRCLSLNSHSGQVSFPGGKEDPSDTDLVQTALRYQALLCQFLELKLD